MIDTAIKLPDGWGKQNIGRSLKLLSGFPFPSKNFSITDGFPLIRIRDVVDSKIGIYFQGPFIPAYIIQKGDVLIGMDGDFNIAKWNNKDALLNQRVLKVDILDLKKLDLNYIYYWLQPYIKKINDITAATTVKHLSTKDLLRAEGEIPKVSIQKRIGTILQTIDQAIEKTEALIEKYQQIKAGLMHDLFTRGITADGKLRPPREEAPELYQETAIGWIPREWESIKMGKHIERNLYGPRFDAGNYSEDGNVKTIRGTDFTKDGEILYNQVPVAFISPAKIQRHILKEGDVVIVTTADCGLTAVFETQDFDFIPSAYAVKYRFSDIICPYFIRFFMQTHCAKKQVNKYVRQGTLGNLPGSDLFRFELALPRKTEQLQIVDRINSIQNKISKEKRIKQKLSHQKSGLMHDLLTGKVPVKVDEPEAAHV